tara:strand:+ start:1053 stop:1211 length:159 start_codon:yes stop_codon:yes gene_type:complete
MIDERFKEKIKFLEHLTEAALKNEGFALTVSKEIIKQYENNFKIFTRLRKRF